MCQEVPPVVVSEAEVSVEPRDVDGRIEDLRRRSHFASDLTKESILSRAFLFPTPKKVVAAATATTVARMAAPANAHLRRVLLSSR